MSLLNLQNPDRKRFDPGKEVEKLVETWLEARAAKQLGFAFHRYPDARAARGALAAQPADWIVGMRVSERARYAFHLEAKDTAEVKRLPKKAIRQYGKLLMFHHAGFETLVVIRRRVVGDWVYLSGSDLFSQGECPPSFLLEDRRKFPDHIQLLEYLFP